jgi:argininosuccinate lyase
MYMSPNYGFIKFPDELTTGSSIMPHKKNPDVWEIMRGNCNRIMATESQISMLCSNMPHGYHREFQLLKDILFPALELMHKCLYMADYMLQHIRINESILDAPIYDYLFTVEEVNRRTLEGMPFRDAYKSVGIEVNEGRFSYQGAPGKTNGQLTPADLRHTSLGSLGNLCTEKIRSKMESAAQF